MADVTLRDLRKTYPGGVEAIKGVSLAIGDGQFCVLVGPSGCGKSTLLRMIAGLETTTSGEIRIGDRVVNDIEPADRDIAMVFQNYALYPHMSVYNNMAYGLRNRGMPKAEIDTRVREAATTLEIAALLDRKPRQLSGGQRQRVAMGRAIVRQPKVFLFDEPLSNLDAKLRIAMRVEIRRLQRRLGTTSVYVTHDQLEAMTLADSLVVMNGGVIEQIGRPLDIYREPATTFVAAFIGAPPMNLLPAHRLGDALGSMAIPGDATIGLRPEDLSLVTHDAPPDAIVLDVGIDAIEHVGAESFVYGTLPKGGDMVVRVPADAELALGSRIRAAIPRAKAHVFGADGRRVPPP